MKTYHILLMSLGLLAVTACSKLDEQIYSSIPFGEYYKTAADAEGAITAAFAPLADLYFTAGTCASDFSADQTYPRAVVGRNTLTLFNYDPNYTTQKSFARDSESPLHIWRSCYAGIEKANVVLERVPDIVMDEKRKKEILGEASFLRAFYHWTLTKNFGDVVLRTASSSTAEKAYAPVVPKADVYKQIFADLDAAVAALPSYTPSLVKGRPSREVAIALYAKAALYAENYALALSKAQEVLSSGKYELVDDPTDLYSVTKEDDARKENMWAFEAERTTPGRTHQLTGLYGPKNSDAPSYGASTFGSIYAYQAFFDSFNPLDERRKLLDTTYINKSGAVVHQKDVTPITPKGVQVKKYQDAGAQGGNVSINVQILRLADVYLIAAEAEVRLNGPTTLAYGYVNKVRERAGLSGLASGLTPQQFIDAVLQERSWEFFGEGDRWYDLTRTNTFMAVIPRAVNDVYPVRTPSARNRYFPIPQDEINANPSIQQNPAWR